jgi:peptidoglycan/LPS O-acetylase OafA/YrhL
MISLRDFYIRRALRLAPALVTVLAFSCVIGVLKGSFDSIGLTPIRFASASLYFANWVRAFDPWNIWFYTLLVTLNRRTVLFSLADIAPGLVEVTFG